jgi:hypothetical protein
MDRVWRALPSLSILLTLIAGGLACDRREDTDLLDNTHAESEAAEYDAIEIPACGQPLPDRFNFRQLSRYVSECSLRSINNLVPLLPERLRSNVTFAFESQSLQKDGVDPLHPRVVMYSDDARLLLAYTGDESKPEARALEVIEFDPRARRFHPRSIEFPAPGEDGRPRILNHPSSCLRCHGDDARPIWASYPVWPGFYGEVDDILQAGLPGRGLENYRQFVDEVGLKSDRYRFLNLDRHQYLPRVGKRSAGKYEDLTNRPNTQLTNLITPLLARRAARIAESTAGYGEKKYEVLLKLGSCGDYALRDRQVEYERGPFDEEYRLYERFTAPAMARYQGAKTRRPLSRDQAARQFPLALAEELGVNVLALLPSGPGQGAVFFEGHLPEFWQFVYRQLLEGQERQAPGLLRAAYANGEVLEHYPELGSRIAEGSFALCRKLKQLKRRSHGTIEPRLKAATSASSAVTRHCATCHTADSELPGPFEAPGALARLYEERPGLREEVLSRLRASPGERMPPDRDLSEPEIRELEEYFGNAGH